jgi:protein phosphatase
MRIKELIEKASFLNADDFSALIGEVNVILEKEREEGKTGEQVIRGGLVYLPLKGKALLVGDLHGDMKSLTYILARSGYMEEKNENSPYLVFLGDYGDRGEESIEVYCLILKLKNLFRKKIILLRGNHEGPRDLKVHPHDLPFFLVRKYGDKGKKIYARLQELFDRLHHSVIVEGKYLMLHGGLPRGVNSVDEIAYAHQTHPRTDYLREILWYLREILWNDPGERKEDYPSPRGAGRIFGEKLTMDILTKVGVRTLIRSHQPCEGVSVGQAGRILTLFSRKGPPYYNSQAAYLEIALSEGAKSGYELAEEACFF